MDSNKQNQKMIQLTGLWKSKSGNSLQGSIGGARLVIIPNAHKKQEKHPDFVAYIAPYEPREQKPGSALDADIFNEFQS